MEEYFPKDFEKTIGSITLNFSLIELFLQFGIMEFSSIDSSLTRCLLAGDRVLDLTNKYENTLIYRLQKEGLLTDELKTEISEFIKYLNKKRSKRNDVIHSLFKMDEETGKIIATKILKRTNTKNEIWEEKPINLKDLQMFEKDLLVATGKLNDFTEKFIKLIRQNKIYKLVGNNSDEKNENKQTETN